MATAADVAAYIEARMGNLPPAQLHALLYYAQAWSLVWDGEALFLEAIEAWPAEKTV